MASLQRFRFLATQRAVGHVAVVIDEGGGLVAHLDAPVVTGKEYEGVIGEIQSIDRIEDFPNGPV